MPSWILPAISGACVAAVIVFVVFWNVGRALFKAASDRISRSL